MYGQVLLMIIFSAHTCCHIDSTHHRNFLEEAQLELMVLQLLLKILCGFRTIELSHFSKDVCSYLITLMALNRLDEVSSRWATTFRFIKNLLFLMGTPKRHLSMRHQQTLIRTSMQNSQSLQQSLENHQASSEKYTYYFLDDTRHVSMLLLVHLSTCYNM